MPFRSIDVALAGAAADGPAVGRQRRNAVSELPEETHVEIQRLCADGDALAERKDYAQALRSYWAAWDLLPEPKVQWEAATWILAAIGDANFLSRDYNAGRDNLSNAMRCPGAIGNPFLHL